MNDYLLYENMIMPDKEFPIRVYYSNCKRPGPIFKIHWHEQIELLYFIKGKAIIHCGSNVLTVEPGDLVVVNSNELHCGESICNETTYYVIISG